VQSAIKRQSNREFSLHLSVSSSPHYGPCADTAKEVGGGLNGEIYVRVGSNP